MATLLRLHIPLCAVWQLLLGAAPPSASFIAISSRLLTQFTSLCWLQDLLLAPGPCPLRFRCLSMSRAFCAEFRIWVKCMAYGPCLGARVSSLASPVAAASFACHFPADLCLELGKKGRIRRRGEFTGSAYEYSFEGNDLSSALYITAIKWAEQTYM